MLQARRLAWKGVRKGLGQLPRISEQEEEKLLFPQQISHG